MGLLDDAIREHLGLKRIRGADPVEVTREEREALGPAVARDTVAQLQDPVEDNTPGNDAADTADIQIADLAAGNVPDAETASTCEPTVRGMHDHFAADHEASVSADEGPSGLSGGNHTAELDMQEMLGLQEDTAKGQKSGSAGQDELSAEP
jgi:hypothetical protein